MELEELKAKWESMKDLPGWKPRPKNGKEKWLSDKIQELEAKVDPEETSEEVTIEQIVTDTPVKEIEEAKKAKNNGFEWEGQFYPYRKGNQYAIISTRRSKIDYYALKAIQVIINGSYYPYEVPNGQIYPRVNMSKCKTCGR